MTQPVDVHRELADGLTEHGYAVLTYDKGACGTLKDCADNEYDPPTPELTIDRFVVVDDAVTALGGRPGLR